MHSIHVIFLLLSKIAYTKFSEGPNQETLEQIAEIFDFGIVPVPSL